MATDIGPTRKFTADEYERLVELGIFRQDERLELIDGDIVEMTPIGNGHAVCAANLHELFVLGLARRALVAAPAPLLQGGVAPARRHTAHRRGG